MYSWVQVTYYLSYILFKGFMLNSLQVTYYLSYVLFKGFMLDEREVNLCTSELCLAITSYRHYRFLPTKSYHNISCTYYLLMLFGWKKYFLLNVTEMCNCKCQATLIRENSLVDSEMITSTRDWKLEKLVQKLWWGARWGWGAFFTSY